MLQKIQQQFQQQQQQKQQQQQQAAAGSPQQQLPSPQQSPQVRVLRVTQRTILRRIRDAKLFAPKMPFPFNLVPLGHCCQKSKATTRFRFLDQKGAFCVDSDSFFVGIDATGGPTLSEQLKLSKKSLNQPNLEFSVRIDARD